MKTRIELTVQKKLGEPIEKGTKNLWVNENPTQLKRFTQELNSSPKKMSGTNRKRPQKL